MLQFGCDTFLDGCALGRFADFQGETQIVTDFLSERFGWTHSMMWPIVPILLAFTLVFSSIAVFALAKINFQRR